MSEDTHTSWIESATATALIPESRRTEFLGVLDGATWLPVQGTHPFSQGYAVREAWKRIPNAYEATYSQSWTAHPGQEAEGHHTIIGLRTSLQELFFLDDGVITMQGVLIRPTVPTG
ncbi:hypothetical protein OG613_48965 (plasmid) [Streptomyces sp. NBC_00015]|uniref:hypothetical protein n=1 Tax=Streptomyces sp. NBC_00015 TaxID=2903611 RepID=UPI002F90BF93